MSAVAAPNVHNQVVRVAHGPACSGVHRVQEVVVVGAIDATGAVETALEITQPMAPNGDGWLLLTLPTCAASAEAATAVSAGSEAKMTPEARYSECEAFRAGAMEDG
eukprot:CAMPEP_0203886412 /NCGR_PEP_ID=MMETSP0359-20131031/30231_1 /ASSEMBLY_ACC=CAM_ASM_000338 /TAXON_ID=268821 /ORGANISM="Scrippsiella Hangoei, Strain SHTV-5" /LENGTH=106 /DNA_ID=CAMNT_0050807231 /DNA_START=20 /DNA_END=340 /DNA_ORIENTATION=+